jgi:hypothetical protein
MESRTFNAVILITVMERLDNGEDYYQNFIFYQHIISSVVKQWFYQHDFFTNGLINGYYSSKKLFSCYVDHFIGAHRWKHM